MKESLVLGYIILGSLDGILSWYIAKVHLFLFIIKLRMVISNFGLFVQRVGAEYFGGIMFNIALCLLPQMALLVFCFPPAVRGRCSLAYIFLDVPKPSKWLLIFSNIGLWQRYVFLVNFTSERTRKIFFKFPDRLFKKISLTKIGHNTLKALNIVYFRFGFCCSAKIIFFSFSATN